MYEDKQDKGHVDILWLNVFVWSGWTKVRYDQGLYSYLHIWAGSYSEMMLGVVVKLSKGKCLCEPVYVCLSVLACGAHMRCLQPKSFTCNSSLRR